MVHLTWLFVIGILAKSFVAEQVIDKEQFDANFLTQLLASVGINADSLVEDYANYEVDEKPQVTIRLDQQVTGKPEPTFMIEDDDDDDYNGANEVNKQTPQEFQTNKLAKNKTTSKFRNRKDRPRRHHVIILSLNLFKFLD